MIAKLSKVNQCRLCLEDQAIKCPIHFFSECPVLAAVRQELFKDSYPTQSMHIIDFLFYYLAGIEILHFWNFWGELLEFYNKKNTFLS